MSFRFLYPATDTGVFHLAIDATTLQAAFEEFRDLHWDDNAGHVAVFHFGELVARVVPRANEETGRNEPVLQMFPGSTTESNRFACGD
ncbi:hypothetical protein P12x_005309 [Tundrisphaera lichenicola]|uniref:hypothetical protein n=1 Tax=Tundrisphaera lichenicola TaxID=2029860 RepID=UPI003EBE160C